MLPNAYRVHVIPCFCVQIYVEVEVDLPTDGSGDMLDIFALSVANVMVCTAPDDVNLVATLNHNDGTGGCLSSQIDADGPYFMINNGDANPYYTAEIIPYSDETNKVRFSFLTLATPRTTIYVHVQVLLTLSEAEAERRRLQGDQNLVGNQFRHFLASTAVVEGETETADSEVEGVMESASIAQIASLSLISSAILLLL